MKIHEEMQALALSILNSNEGESVTTPAMRLATLTCELLGVQAQQELEAVKSVLMESDDDMRYREAGAVSAIVRCVVGERDHLLMDDQPLLGMCPSCGSKPLNWIVRDDGVPEGHCTKCDDWVSGSDRDSKTIAKIWRALAQKLRQQLEREGR